MGTAALPVVLIALVVAFSAQSILSTNRDLFRAREWGELARRFMPFGVLTLMALSLLAVRSLDEGWVMFVWMVVFGIAIILATIFSVPTLERRANGVFRRGDYATAADLYGELVEQKPLARNEAFLGAALGASERFDESLEASTKAIEKDPEYGLAYYNRALVLRRTGKTSKAVKDLKKALDVDLPRRFRSAARKMLEELA